MSFDCHYCNTWYAANHASRRSAAVHALGASIPLGRGADPVQQQYYPVVGSMPSTTSALATGRRCSLHLGAGWNYGEFERPWIALTAGVR